MLTTVRDAAQRAGGLVSGLVALAGAALVIALVALIVAVKGGRRAAGA